MSCVFCGVLCISLTFHEGCVGTAVVVKVSAVRVVQAVVSQTVCVAKTLEDAIHKTLQQTHTLSTFSEYISEHNPSHTP